MDLYEDLRPKRISLFKLQRSYGTEFERLANAILNGKARLSVSGFDPADWPNTMPSEVRRRQFEKSEFYSFIRHPRLNPNRATASV